MLLGCARTICRECTTASKDVASRSGISTTLGCLGRIHGQMGPSVPSLAISFTTAGKLDLQRRVHHRHAIRLFGRNFHVSSLGH